MNSVQEEYIWTWYFLKNFMYSRQSHGDTGKTYESHWSEYSASRRDYSQARQQYKSDMTCCYSVRVTSSTGYVELCASKHWRLHNYITAKPYNRSRLRGPHWP
jgi:hypothetical protein